MLSNTTIQGLIVKNVRNKVTVREVVVGPFSTACTLQPETTGDLSDPAGKIKHLFSYEFKISLQI